MLDIEKFQDFTILNLEKLRIYERNSKNGFKNVQEIEYGSRKIQEVFHELIIKYINFSKIEILLGVENLKNMSHVLL